MARYEHDDGDWFRVPKTLMQQCCSCGLVHAIDFRQHKKEGLQMRFTRDERATSAARRSRKKNVVIVDE